MFTTFGFKSMYFFFFLLISSFILFFVANLSYIEMKQPWVSPSRSPHPPPSPPAPSRSSQCTRSKCLSHASNNSGKNLYYFFLDAFPHVSEYIYHELIKFTKGDKEHDS